MRQPIPRAYDSIHSNLDPLPIPRSSWRASWRTLRERCWRMIYLWQNSRDLVRMRNLEWTTSEDATRMAHVQHWDLYFLMRRQLDRTRGVIEGLESERKTLLGRIPKGRRNGERHG